MKNYLKAEAGVGSCDTHLGLLTVLMKLDSSSPTEAKTQELCLQVLAGLHSKFVSGSLEFSQINTLKGVRVILRMRP